MAKITAATSLVGLDMGRFPEFPGNLTTSANQISVTAGLQRQDYFGSFTFSSSDVFGTLTGTSYTNAATGMRYAATDLSFNANAAALYINSGNAPVLMASILKGADHVTGSSFGDILMGFDGNDELRGAGGNDVIDGGLGRDSAFFTGRKADFTITKMNTGLTVNALSGPDGADNLLNIERLRFDDLGVAFDINGTAGQAYRLYQAAFDRKPDLPGLGVQMAALDRGVSLNQIAHNFIDSAEFKSLYGENLSNEGLITKLYNNVLHRAPEKAGFDHWMNVLGTKQLSRSEVLYFFSESDENQAQVIGQIQNGIDYVWAV